MILTYNRFKRKFLISLVREIAMVLLASLNYQLENRARKRNCLQ